jgi:CRISPR-associated endoribonuclease Cas6
MRIHLSTSSSNSIVPFDHLPSIVGALHKWLGANNEWHHKTSLYSFSWLRGGSPKDGGLSFPQGAQWFISSYDDNFVKALLAGIQDTPEINYGLTVRSITIQEDPVFPDKRTFLLASPVLIKRRDGEKIEHIVYTDPRSDQFITDTLVTKLKIAGIKADGIQASFERNYHASRTKMVNYNGIRNRSSLCPVTIEGTPEQLAFVWNVGVGNSTGIGFGALI